jgi:hypothetical protein
MAASSLPVSEEWKRELANLASIPEANRRLFYEDIQDPLWVTVSVWYYPKNTDPEVIAAAAAVRVALKAIAALNFKQAYDLAQAMKLEMEFSPRTRDSKMEALTLLDKVNRAFVALTGRPGYDLDGKRGRPKGSAGAIDFRWFLGQLLQCVHNHGGRLTFNPKKFDREKDRGGGTLLDALKCLRPALPDGLIPEAADLRLKTIQEICTRERSARRAEVHSSFNSELDGEF